MKNTKHSVLLAAVDLWRHEDRIEKSMSSRISAAELSGRTESTQFKK